MKVTVLYFADFKDITGLEKENYDLDKSELKDLINLIFEKYSLLKALIWDNIYQKLKPTINVAINDKLIKNKENLSTKLCEGDRIAILLPFSGGWKNINEEIKQIKSGIYKKGEVSFDDIFQTIKRNPNVKEAGAILSFTGIVRNISNEGKFVKSLKIDAYDDLANETINKISNEIKKKFGIADLIIIHLKGDFEISEDLVYVFLASAHREEGFDALREAVEKYKKELSIWKREDYINGNSKWVY